MKKLMYLALTFAIILGSLNSCAKKNDVKPPPSNRIETFSRLALPKSSNRDSLIRELAMQNLLEAAKAAKKALKDGYTLEELSMTNFSLREVNDVKNTPMGLKIQQYKDQIKQMAETSRGFPFEWYQNVENMCINSVNLYLNDIQMVCSGSSSPSNRVQYYDGIISDYMYYKTEAEVIALEKAIYDKNFTYGMDNDLMDAMAYYLTKQ